MAAARSKFTRSLIAIAVLIAGLWTYNILAHQHDVAKTKKANRTTPAADRQPRPGLITYGLDLKGGLSVVLEPKAGEAFNKGSLQTALEIIRNRVDSLGVAEPDISLQGDNILVQLPGIKDPKRAIDLIGTTAKLEFRPVLGTLSPTAKPPAGVTVPDCAVRSTYPVNPDPTKDVVLCAEITDQQGNVADPSTWSKLALGPVAVQGTEVKTANASLPSGSNTATIASWQVDLSLTGTGAKKFQEVTAKLACNAAGSDTRQLAIVLDEVVKSHPQMGDNVNCNEGISGGTAQITGNFTEKEAKDLALVLKYGALPVDLTFSTTTTVSPTLGREALHSGLVAGAIGLGIVFLYVLLFYRALGLIVWLGLATHATLTIGVVVLLGRTAGFALSLAGIAGLIVSLGIATDSFIVYFERIKDEVHQGKTVRASVDRAWTSAWRTIVAADLVTALAAVVLYFLAVGSVRGFALTLGLSTALDLFVSRLFMHPAVWILAQTRRFNESKTLGMGSVAGVGDLATVGGTR
ncbi:MAG: protein translocase subunit SecD [Actinomycetota bacterium]